MESQSINVRQLIYKEIAQCATKRMGRLFFPKLISKLCIKSNAPVVQDEKVLTEKRFINQSLLGRLMVFELLSRCAIPIGAINEMVAHKTRISAKLVSSNL